MWERPVLFGVFLCQVEVNVDGQHVHRGQVPGGPQVCGSDLCFLVGTTLFFVFQVEVLLTTLKQADACVPHFASAAVQQFVGFATCGLIGTCVGCTSV